MKPENIIYIDCQSNDYIEDSLDKKYDNYTLDQCVLVRTTDIFPFDKIIETPINGNAYDFGRSSIMDDAIKEKIKKDIDFYTTFDYDKFEEESKKYSVCFETFRSTIHFTVNGLVSSHAYGNFEDRGFIIIEPLKHHIQDNSLIALRAEDTYFNENMLLSDEAAIIISEEKFNELKQQPEYISTLENFKIFIYKGNNQKEAVQKTLSYLGYDSFIVNNHGYTNGISNNTAASKMVKYINELRNQHNINGDKHFYSEINLKDRIKRQEQGEKTDLEHFLYILNNAITIPIKFKEKIQQIMEQNPENLKEIMPEIVEAITLEEIERLTKEFNQIFINNLKSKSTKGDNKNL